MNLQRDTWSSADYDAFVKELHTYADLEYRKFHHSLVPDTELSMYIGVRTPDMRMLAREISKGNAREFLAVAKSDFYEERIIRFMVTGRIRPRDFDDLLALQEAQLPLINSWALNDNFCVNMKNIKKFRQPYFDYLKNDLIKRGDPWMTRAALIMMLDYYLDDEYIDEVLRLADSVNSDEYYVQMGQAWLIATALAKCRDKAMAYMDSGTNMSAAAFNKTIQKAIESRRVSDEDKSHLRALKRK